MLPNPGNSLPMTFEIKEEVNMPWAMRRPKRVPFACSSSRWIGLRSPERSANFSISSCVNVFMTDAVSPTLHLMMTSYRTASGSERIDLASQRKTFSASVNASGARFCTLLFSQELQYRRIEFRSLLNIWNVTALIDNKQCRIRNVALESLPVAHWSQAI